MSTSEERGNVSSSFSESSDEETPSVQDGGDPAEARRTARTVQVVSSAPRPRRGSDSSSGSDGEDTEDGGSSSSEEEIEGSSRDTAHIPSIIARKPKKKVYAKSNGIYAEH